LKKSLFLFKMMANPTVVSLGSKLTKLSFKLHLPVKGLVKKTIFEQFCGGETEQDCLTVISRMSEKGVCSILDYSVEGKESEVDFDAAKNKKLELVEFAKNKTEIPFVVMKPTALGRFALWVKVSEKKALTEKERAEWERDVERFDSICKATFEANLSILFDAEES